MQTRKLLTLSASLAALLLGVLPAHAQTSFRDDGSVVVNNGVLESLEPVLKRPTANHAIRLHPLTAKRSPDKPGRGNQAATKHAAGKQGPDKRVAAEPAKPVKPAVAHADTPPKHEPTKTAAALPAPVAPPVAPSAPPATQPTQPTPPAKAPEPIRRAEAPASRLVGPLTDSDPDKYADPILPPSGVTRALPSAAGHSAPAPAASGHPAAAAAGGHPAAAERPTTMAAVTPAAPPPPTSRGLVTPQPITPPAAAHPPAQAQAPQAQAPKVDTVAARGAGSGFGPSVQQRDSGVRLLFPVNEATLPEDALQALAGIARRLEAEHNLYVQLLAYAEGTEDEASKARRLSLSRALAVRSYLMNDGVRSTRIEVRALGHKAEGGPADRVDVVIDKRY